MTTATGLSPGDHVCWPFHGMADLVTTARGYVSEGLDRHERVTFCRVDGTGMQHAVITEVTQVGRPTGADQPVLTSLVPEPGWAPWTSPVVALGSMTQAAVADGYTGLRVLTDATEIVRDRQTRPWWVRGEHLIDRYGPRPLTIMCSYDVDLLGDEVVAEVACLHALTGDVPCSFLLRAVDGGLALVGEVDRTSAVDLHDAVMGIGADLPRPIALDLSEHEFIDHSALVALDRAARALGTTIDLVGASPLTACLVGVLGLTGVEVREAG